jgi:hypothetical protein
MNYERRHCRAASPNLPENEYWKLAPLAEEMLALIPAFSMNLEQ